MGKKDDKNDKAKKNKANKNKPAVLGAPKTIEKISRDDKPNRRPANPDKRPPMKEDFFNRDHEVPPRRQGDFQQNQVGAVDSNDGFRQNDGFGNRGRGRGGGRGRGFGGRGRGFGGDRGGFAGKREFDRRSGSDRTGIKPVEKREGGGSYNWGTPEDDIAEPLNDTLNTSDEVPPTDVPADDVENKDPQEEEPATVEEKEMTLDEWKASQQRAKPTYNLRKAGEGCDDKQWKKTYLVKKKVDEEESEEESDDEEVDDSRHVNIEIRFNDPHRGGGRGRGGFPGRGGRGGGFGTPEGRGPQGSGRKANFQAIDADGDGQ